MENNTDIYAYSINSKQSIANKASLNVRKKIFERLASAVDFSSLDAVLDVGVTADKNRLESNFFELLFPDVRKITAFSDQDAQWMEEVYAGLKFVRGDGRKMPFEDGAFDLVFSSAVIEHVGNEEQQFAFLSECCRVSRKYVFLTTPNRWHPLDFHTALPFLHWLPKVQHRCLLQALHYDYLAQESNLNLLDKRQLIRFCTALKMQSHTIKTVNFLGFPSNLLLFVCLQK